MTLLRQVLLLSAVWLACPALAATDAAGRPLPTDSAAQGSAAPIPVPASPGLPPTGLPATGMPATGLPSPGLPGGPDAQQALPALLPRPGSLLDQPSPRAAAPVIAPVAEDGLPPLREWLVVSRNLAEAEQQRKALLPWRLSILRRQQLEHLQQVISVYRIPPEVDLQQLEQQLRRHFPDWQQERNQRFRPLQQRLPEAAEEPLRRWGQRAVGQSQPAPPGCGEGRVLAMLDGPLNSGLAVFSGALLDYQSQVPSAFAARSSGAADHATAVAALLVGRGQVAGLVPGARLHALGVFGEDREAGLHSRSDWLLVALDQLAGLEPAPTVVNLSFGGSGSPLLQRFLGQLSARMTFVAAAGNDGREGVRYPAADPAVLAVGAVDVRLQRVRLSNTGKQLDLVAPGEDIWTLDASGQGFFASGTSFAAPFVAAAVLLSPPAAGQLERLAEDLGPAGRDDLYGWGVLRLASCH